MSGRTDRLAFGMVFAVSLTLYTLTLAPTVTLEYSGSMITAADYLGVANSPGYPVWTLLAWFFQRVFGFMRYHGQPNPAWGINFMSAFFGAASCGLIAWLVARVSRDRDDPRAASFISGISAGVAFALNPFMWSQSVIAEMATLNVFSVVVFLALTYLGCSTGDGRYLYPLSFLIGIGFLNSPTFVLLIPVYLAVCALLARWKYLPAMLGLLTLGFLPLIYLPIASAQNPPINWGYARTSQGFFHLITRGQYEHLTFAALSDLPRQMLAYGRLLVPQFTLPAMLLGLPALSLLNSPRIRLWFLVLLLAFLMYSIVMTWGMNPHQDLQTLFIGRVQWIPSCAITAILIGLGMARLLSFVSCRGQRVFAPACLAAMLISMAPLMAQFDPDFIRRFGGSEQRGCLGVLPPE